MNGVAPRAGGTMSRTLAAAPIASLAFVMTLMLAAVAVRNGLVGDDTLRLWAGASTAADGQVTVGRIVTGYPTLPFLATTVLAWLAPAGTPAPALVAAALFSIIAAFCFLSLRRAGFHYVLAAVATLLIVFHPALLRAVIGGPADMLLATFLLMLCVALFDLRARGGTSEVMAVGLALMALAFAHPVGAALAGAAMPFLAFAVRPLLAARSVWNVVIALIFPTLFMMAAFAYVSWTFPGDGWTFFGAPAQNLSLWRAAVERIFGNSLSGLAVIDGILAMGLALAISAPVTIAVLARVHRRRGLVMPAVVFVCTAIAATIICLASGFFGDPTAVIVAAPMLAATVLIRVPEARQRVAVITILLVLGWIGGFVSVALVDPVTLNRLESAFTGTSSERLDAIAAGGATAQKDGVLADTDNAPALVLGRGNAHGLLGPETDAFAVAKLLGRVETPFVAVPDPQSATGAHDRLIKAFPSLFREGAKGYRLIYQNNTWRLYGKMKESTVQSK